MRLEHLTWPKAQEYFEKNDLVLLGVGSIECHGRHLALGTDTLIPGRLLEMIEARRDDVLIAPTVPYGAAESFEAFPGTVSIGAEVLYQVLSGVAGSLYRHGARRFAILNGHGGNTKSIERLAFALAEKGAIVAGLNWWQMVWDLNPAWKGGHGGGEETAAMLAISHKLVDMEESREPLTLNHISDEIRVSPGGTVSYKGVTVNIPRRYHHTTKNGWLGTDHPGTATVQWGAEMLEAATDYIVDFLDAFSRVNVASALSGL